MKRILVLVNAEMISPDSNGGGALIFSHIELLYKLNYELIIVPVVWNNQYSYKEEDYKEIQEYILKVIPLNINPGTRKRRLNWIYHTIFKPAEFEYFFLNQENLKALKDLTSKVKADLVWCEWRWAAILTWKCKLNIPTFYSHHDWEFKLALLRENPSINKRFHAIQKKRVEIQMIKDFDACISGSFTESEEIATISSKPSLYLPITYHTIKQQLLPNNSPSIVHLGGMGTTANRIGLERFLDICWDELKKQIPNIKLKVIGSLTKAGTSLKSKLNDTQIETLGFVQDLSSVLYPEDIHIVPWEYNTGTRTRIPTVFNYSQVLVATKESVKCFPEIDETNAVLCSNLEDMKDQIIDLYSDRERLHLLAVKGKNVFENTFTTDSKLAQLDHFIKSSLH